MYNGRLLVIDFHGRRSPKWINGWRTFLRVNYGLTGEFQRSSTTFDDLLFLFAKIAKPATVRQSL
jgi:hypothetical protein